MAIEVIVHSDDNSIAGICREYWHVNDDGSFQKTVSALSAEHSLTPNELSKLIKSNCTAYSNVACVQCDSPYTIANRSSLKSVPLAGEWVCESCQRENRDTEFHTKYEIILLEHEKSLLTPVHIDELSARAAIFLMALMKYAASENLDEIDEYGSNKSDILSPSEDYDHLILKELYRSGIIVVSENSSMTAVTLKEEGGFSFYLDRVKWCIPLPQSVSTSAFYTALESLILSKSLLESDYASIVSLCREVSKVECLSYLELALAEHRLGFNPGEKTNAVIVSALQAYSVSQVYNFIWRTAKDAAAFYVRNRTSRDHAAKTVVSSIERQLERAQASSWNITPFRRNYELPQSVLSRVLFNVLLGTDDGGFHRKLSEIL